METRYRFAEHGGEVELELDAPTEAGVFEAAVEAFAELVSDEDAGETARHEIELAGSDRALLLVDTLNELVFLTETARFVPERLESLELRDDRLRATVTRGHSSRP